MADMPRPRPPHLHKQITRHRKVTWYFRVGHGPKTRIRAEFGTPEFWQEYEAARTGQPAAHREEKKTGTLRWLWEQYQQSSAWKTDLSYATRRQRENIMKHVLALSGDEPFGKITRKHIVAGRDRRSSTPHAARHFLDTMKGLFAWAVEAEHVKVDPAAGVKAPKVKKGAGFKMWTDGEVERYEKRWPEGTRERVWLHVLLYTALRRGDAVRIGPKHVWNSEATLKTEKSGEEIEVTIPILPILQKTLDAGPIGESTYIAGKRGKPLTKESFGNMFKDACRTAGIDEQHKAAHGLRKVGASRCANNGATIHQLMSLFGWVTEHEALHYTKKADRKRLGRGAAQLLEKQDPPLAEVVDLQKRSAKRPSPTR